jgi:hypothetical protein
MQREDLRRWVDGHRAAQRRERDEAIAAGPQPGAAIGSALALVALAGRLHGWPIAEDQVERREDAAARAAWDRLRAARLSDDRAG